MPESIAKERFFDPAARYRSNDGKGPLTARMVDVTEENFIMERWSSRKTSKKIRFEIPIWFLLHSPQCGWRKVS